jgi:hypothetical protein
MLLSTVQAYKGQLDELPPFDIKKNISGMKKKMKKWKKKATFTFQGVAGK